MPASSSIGPRPKRSQSITPTPYSLVENMTGVKRAVNKAPQAVLGQRLRQYSGQPPRGPSEPAVCGVELDHFLAGVVDHVSRTQGQPDLDRQRRGAPQPARGQLAGALPPPAFEELLRRRALEPPDGQDL